MKHKINEIKVNKFSFLQNNYYLLPLIFCISVLVRLIYYYEVKEDIFLKYLIIDADFYNQWAVSIVNGGILGESGVYYQDPLYAYFLAVIYKIFGLNNYFVVRIIQIFMDSTTCIMMFLISERLFNNKNLSIIASLLYCFSPVLIFYTVLLDKTTLSLFLIAWSLLYLIKAIQEQNIKNYFYAGLLLGACTLIRGNIMIFVIFSLIGIFVKIHKNYLLKTVLIYIVLFLIGVLIPITTVTLRNVIIGKDFVVISANSGLNLFIGNNKNASGSYYEPYDIQGVPDEELETSWRAAERLSNKRYTKASEVSNYWFNEALEYIVLNPQKHMVLLLKKFYLIFSSFEIAETYSFYYFKNISTVLKIPISFGLFIAAGILGIYMNSKKSNNSLIIKIFIFSYIISMLIFFVTGRYRIPLLIGLIPFSSLFIVELYKLIRNKKGYLIFVLSFIIIFLLTNYQNVYLKTILKPASLSISYSQKGYLYSMENNLLEAIKNYKIAISYNQNSFKDYYDLGNLYMQLGEYIKAKECFYSTIEIKNDYAEAYNNLGVLAILENHKKEANEYLSKAYKYCAYEELQDIILDNIKKTNLMSNQKPVLNIIKQ
ncbi:MAG: hypothetical protein A2252_07950 [Elusimicrobia bacterium RIFOXYA2_FULL_39_19]|nr:MAG: hypothetical protein A2252_07950 [Elusimicrobia bacterium RIFOXYA2_FULL_39_19]